MKTLSIAPQRCQQPTRAEAKKALNLSAAPNIPLAATLSRTLCYKNHLSATAKKICQL